MAKSKNSSDLAPQRLAGITGVIDLPSGNPSAADLTDRVHILPCSIKHDGPCAVSHYFRPRKTDVAVDGLSVEEAFFRGRRLQGTTVSLPDGYRCYVLGKKKSGNEKANSAGEEEFGQWAARAEFRNIAYWNHGSAPSRDDPLMRSFHWFSIADALHKPITAEELASASATHPRGDTTKFLKDGNDIKVKPKALSIIWGKDNRYWRLPNQDEDPVELLQVCWLEVSGSVPLSSLEKGKDYQVSFDVEMKPDAFGWANSPVYLMVKPGKSGRYVWRKSDLSTKNAGRHHLIPTAEGKVLKFTVKNSDEGANDELLFGMYEIWKGRWKGGMVIHGVKIERC